MVEMPAGTFTYVRDMSPPIYEPAVKYEPSAFQFVWTEEGSAQPQVTDIDGGNPGHENGWILWDPATNTATLNTQVRLPVDTEIWMGVRDGAKSVTGFVNGGGYVGKVIYLHGQQIMDVRPGANPDDTNPYHSRAIFQIPG
jgi:hypothetical protein